MDETMFDGKRPGKHGWSATFPLYLKEIEWKFNHRNKNLVILLRRLPNQQIFIVKGQI